MSSAAAPHNHGGRAAIPEEEEKDDMIMKEQLAKSGRLHSKILHTIMKDNIDEDLVYLELYELATYFEYRLRTEYKFTTEEILYMQKVSVDAAEEYIKHEDELDLKYERAKWRRKKKKEEGWEIIL